MSVSRVCVRRREREQAQEAARARGPRSTSACPASFGACASIRSLATLAFAPVSRIAARRNAAFLAFDSTSVKCRSGEVLAGNRDDEPRKTCAASEIDPFAKIRRRMLEELQAVGDMPRPHVIERRLRATRLWTRCHSASSATKRSRSRLRRIRDEAESIERVGG